MAGLLLRVEVEAADQIGLDVAVPVFAERGEVFQRTAHGHPRIKRDLVRHISQPRFYGNLIFARVEPEHARGAGVGAQQIQQAFDGRGLARAVTAEETVATPGADGQAQAVDGIQLAVAAGQIFEFDDGRVTVHGVSF